MIGCLVSSSRVLERPIYISLVLIAGTRRATLVVPVLTFHKHDPPIRAADVVGNDWSDETVARERSTRLNCEWYVDVQCDNGLQNADFGAFLSK